MSSVHLGYVYKISLEQLTVLPWRHAQGGKAPRLGWCLVLYWERQQRKMAAGWMWPMALAWIKCWKCFWLLSYFSNPKHFSSYGREVQTGCLRRLIKRDHRQCLDSTGGIRLAVAAQGRRPSIRKSPCIKSKRQRLSDKTHYHFIICCMTSQMICCDERFPSSSFTTLSWLNCVFFQPGSVLKRSSQTSVGLDDVNTRMTFGRLTSLARSLIEERSVSTVHKSFYNGPI